MPDAGRLWGVSGRESVNWEQWVVAGVMLTLLGILLCVPSDEED